MIVSSTTALELCGETQEEFSGLQQHSCFREEMKSIVSIWSKVGMSEGRMYFLDMAFGQVIRVSTLYRYNYCSGIFNDRKWSELCFNMSSKRCTWVTRCLFSSCWLMGWQTDEGILFIHLFISLLVRALGTSQKWTKQPNNIKIKFQAQFPISWKLCMKTYPSSQAKDRITSDPSSHS